MEEKVLSAVKLFSLLSGGEKVTVALSGGADSVSLLFALLRLQKRLDITVSAAHFNHMIRGAEAVRDEAFARELCERLGVPFTAGRGDVPRYAAENKISEEAAARELRYAFLEKADGLVATAHTASDNFETVLFNLTRGAALGGLCGIPPKRGKFIRPLLFCTREDVEQYCKENRLDFITDSTNLSDDYTRNNIRHNVIPVLKEINPSAEAAVMRTVLSLSETNDFITGIADKFLSDNIKEGGLCVTSLPHPAAAQAAIRRFTEIQAGFQPDNAHTDALYNIAQNGGRTSLPQNFEGICKNGILKIESISGKKGKKYLFRVKTERRINDLFTKSEKVNNLLLKNSLACDKIIGKSVLRTRQPGDSIRLAGRGCTKTLKKLFCELAVPEDMRAYIPVIADDKGVIWIYGVGVADRCAVTKKTKEITVITASAVQNITD